MRTVEEAYELDLTQVILPAHSADRVTLKECDGCFTAGMPAPSVQTSAATKAPLRCLMMLFMVLSSSTGRLAARCS